MKFTWLYLLSIVFLTACGGSSNDSSNTQSPSGDEKASGERKVSADTQVAQEEDDSDSQKDVCALVPQGSEEQNQSVPTIDGMEIVDWTIDAELLSEIEDEYASAFSDYLCAIEFHNGFMSATFFNLESGELLNNLVVSAEAVSIGEGNVVEVHGGGNVTLGTYPHNTVSGNDSGEIISK